jgi:hypothetical protein
LFYRNFDHQQDKEEDYEMTSHQHHYIKQRKQPRMQGKQPRVQGKCPISSWPIEMSQCIHHLPLTLLEGTHQEAFVQSHSLEHGIHLTLRDINIYYENTG